MHGEELIGDYPLQVQSTARPSEMVVSSSSSAMSNTARNLVGMHTICGFKAKECHNNEGDHDEDSEDRKRKAMDRLRKVSTYNCLLPHTTCVLRTICANWLMLCVNYTGLQTMLYLHKYL